MTGRTELEPLRRVLDARPTPAILWWRDDDAGRPHPNLDRLLALARATATPVALAVVPAWLEEPVAEAIRAIPEATVLQHGWAHEDQAAPGERRIELGGRADRGRLRNALARGRELLTRAFGARFLPILVPPWNRIARDLLGDLPGLGFCGLSIWDEGDLGPMPGGLARLDVHVDPIDWRGGRRWLGLASITERLAARLARGERPVGLVTHHLVTGPEAWHELALLLELLHEHPGARLMPVGSLLGEAG
jgi:hypothetical protein